MAGTFEERDQARGAPQTFEARDQARAPASKRGVWDNIVGAEQTLVRSIPGADEVNDFGNAVVRTAADLATGKKQATPRMGKTVFDDPAFRENLAAQRAKSKGQAAGFAAAHPKAADLTKGAGMATSLVPAFFTGGATLAPAAAGATAAGGLLGGLASRLAPLLKSGTVGGLMGGLTGLADEGTLPQRLSEANAAIPSSVALGAALPLAAGASMRGINAAARLFQPAEQKVAATAGRVLAARAPEAAAPAPVAANEGVLPFERMGRGGQSLARAVANVPGPGQEIAENVLNARRASAPDRMLASTGRELGEGSDFHPTLEALDALRKGQAKPLYEAAYDREPPVSDKLTQLMGRPSVRDAMRRAITLAREEGQDATGLGLFHMEDRTGWASDTPPSFDAPADAVRAAGRGGAGPAPASRGPSLAKFIADRGGIRGATGELSAMDAQTWHKGKAYQRRLEGDGDTLDGWAEKAWEAGYFPGHAERPTPRDLLDAISGELRGKPTFAREPDTGRADAFRRRGEAGEAVYRGAAEEDLPHPDQYVGRPEPQTGPVYGETPNWRGLDYIKRGLDDVIEGERDQVTRRLPATQDMRSKARTRDELRRHLVELNPAYGEALGAYQGPSRQIDAVHLGRKLVTGRMDPEDVETGLAKMSADELDGLRLGMARGLSDQFRGGHPQAAFRRFAGDRVVQDRLRHGFGDDAAYQRFLGDIQREVEAQHSYNRVLSGSRTTPLAQEIEATNRAAGGGGPAQAIGEAVSRRAGGVTWTRQAVEAAIRNWERVRQPGLNNPEVSRLLGEALFQSGDPQALLRAMVQQQLITPQEVRGVLPFLAAGAGEGVASSRSAARP